MRKRQHEEIDNQYSAGARPADGLPVGGGSESTVKKLDTLGNISQSLKTRISVSVGNGPRLHNVTDLLILVSGDCGNCVAPICQR